MARVLLNFVKTSEKNQLEEEIWLIQPLISEEG
jgi:hypothetical protein